MNRPHPLWRSRLIIYPCIGVILVLVGVPWTWALIALLAAALVPAENRRLLREGFPVLWEAYPVLLPVYGFLVGMVLSLVWRPGNPRLQILVAQLPWFLPALGYLAALVWPDNRWSFRRVGRLVRAELLKLTHHPFFFIAVGLLIVATLLGAWSQTILGDAKPSAWRPASALQTFAYGSKFGLKMASFLLVIFGSMLFAGEFDRGTIKLLLTRPITRPDLFVAKCLTGTLLAGFLVLLVLALSLGVGCATGELGPVWDKEHYVSVSSYEELAGQAIQAIRLSLPSVAAAVFLGIAVSTLVESSGFAVAIALALYIGIDLGLGFSGERASRYFFNYYPAYAFEVFRQFAEGTAARWDERVTLGGLSWKIPGASAGLFSALAYAVFVRKNIIA